MSLTYQIANEILDAYLQLESVWIQLHVGDPGADGISNVAQVDDGMGGTEDIARKSISFGDAPVGETNDVDEQVIYSTSAVEWANTEIDAAQTITHFSLWPHASDEPPAADPLFIAELATPKIVGSDGANIVSGDAFVALQVYVKES